MEILYRRRRATVEEVRAELPDASSPSSVRKLLDIMIERGLLGSRIRRPAVRLLPRCPARARQPVGAQATHSDLLQRLAAVGDGRVARPHGRLAVGCRVSAAGGVVEARTHAGRITMNTILQTRRRHVADQGHGDAGGRCGRAGHPAASCVGGDTPRRLDAGHCRRCWRCRCCRCRCPSGRSPYRHGPQTPSPVPASVDTAPQRWRISTWPSRCATRCRRVRRPSRRRSTSGASGPAGRRSRPDSTSRAFWCCWRGWSSIKWRRGVSWLRQTKSTTRRMEPAAR